MFCNKTFSTYDLYILLLESFCYGGCVGVFGCCFNYPNDWIANDWFFHDESCFKLSISTFRCFISLFSLSSSDWFVDELHLDGSFPWLFLMLSDISCSIVALCWVVVDIIVLLDFFSLSVFFVYVLICHNTNFSCFLVRNIFFLNFWLISAP